MSSCLSCGAPLAPDLRACQYCGSPTDLASTTPSLVDQAWTLLQYLRQLGTPEVKDAVLLTFWWIFAILSMGLLWLLWDRPKLRCDPIEHQTLVTDLNFLIQSGMAQASEEERARLVFIQQEVDRLVVDVTVAKKRNRKVAIVVVVMVLILAAVGAEREKEETASSQSTSTSQVEDSD